MLIDKIKGKYEVILGFVTLIISLSAFKDELKIVNLNLGFAHITLADYLLYIVYGFSICLYLYVTENIARDFNIGKLKIFDYSLALAYILFVFILLSPIILLIVLGSVQLLQEISERWEYQKKFINSNIFDYIIQAITVIVSTLSLLFSLKTFKERRSNLKNEMIVEAELHNISYLDSANKLLKDGYYSHSILESFKVLERLLATILAVKNIRFTRNMRDIIEQSLKYNIIDNSDYLHIKKLMDMRNHSAHLSTQFTEEEAKYALTIVDGLLKKLSEIK